MEPPWKKLFYLTTEHTEKIAQSSQRFYLKKNLVPWSLRGKKLFYLTTEHTEKIAQSSQRFYLKKKLSALEPPWQKTILFEAGTPFRGGLPIQYWDLL